MKQYRNTKTGVIVCVESDVGGEWELISLPSSEKAKAEEKPKKAKKTPKKK